MVEETAPTVQLPPTAPSVRPFWLPVRNLILTVCLTVLAFLAANYLWKDDGVEILVIGMGWAHVVLGFLFFTGRVARNESGSRDLFKFLCFLAALLLLLHYRLNLTFFIFAFFLFHAFRDELAIYFQTRDKSKTPASVYQVRGFFPMLLLALLMFQPQDFRQYERRLSVRTSQMNSNGWTLIRFEPVEDSAGKNYHFNLQSPQSKDASGYFAYASSVDRYPEGHMRQGDRLPQTGKDLLFRAAYDDDGSAPYDVSLSDPDLYKLDLAGNNRVGQTFIAEHDGLSGIWIRTELSDTAAQDLRFNFKLDSPPLFPLEFPWTRVRVACIVLIAMLFIWQILRSKKNDLAAWAYLGIIGLLVLLYQQLVKPASNIGYLMPNGIIFVVFHYFSWYVFSFGKFKGFKPAAAQGPFDAGVWNLDRFLRSLRNPLNFAFVVVILTAISFAGAIWYHLGDGPEFLKYGFKGEYFLYVLLFHVTFSINPAGLLGRMRIVESVPKPI